MLIRSYYFREYKDVLPCHKPEYNKRHLNTTQKSDYQYPFEWSPTTKTVMNIILHLIDLTLPTLGHSY